MSAWRNLDGKGIPSSPLPKHVKEEINEYLKSRREKGYTRSGVYEGIQLTNSGKITSNPDRKPHTYRGFTQEEEAESQAKFQERIYNCLTKLDNLKESEIVKLRDYLKLEGGLSQGHKNFVSRIHNRLFPKHEQMKNLREIKRLEKEKRDQETRELIRLCLINPYKSLTERRINKLRRLGIQTISFSWAERNWVKQLHKKYMQLSDEK